MLWQHGREELDSFVNHLNTRVGTIKFTHECSPESVSFLDVTVKLNNGIVETDLYCKPTDSHDYLLYSSSHPQKCKDSIPYSQFVRIRRLCSNITDFEDHVIEFAAHLKRREYPSDLIIEAAIAARSLNRHDLLAPTRPVKSGDSEKVFLITTYHPSDHTLRNLVRNNWDILGQSENTAKLHNKHLTVGYRRPKNLRDALVHAGIARLPGDELADPNHVAPHVVVNRNNENVSTVTNTLRQSSIRSFLIDTNGATPTTSVSNTSLPRPDKVRHKGTNPAQRGFTFCKHTICRFCPKLNKSGKITSNTTGSQYHCMKNISCRSSNLIYCITCRRCGLQYVGQTLRRLKDRVGEHFTSVDNTDQTKTIGRHFSKTDHNGILDIEISVLEFIKKPPKSEAAAIIRDRIERRWIQLLRSRAPQGLNIED